MTEQEYAKIEEQVIAAAETRLSLYHPGDITLEALIRQVRNEAADRLARADLVFALGKLRPTYGERMFR